MPLSARWCPVLLFPLLALVQPLSAQLPGTGTIRGTILGPDGAIADATVRLLGADRRATTDQQGRFELADVVPAQYTLEVTALGFAADRRTVRVIADGLITLTV